MLAARSTTIVRRCGGRWSSPVRLSYASEAPVPTIEQYVVPLEKDDLLADPTLAIAGILGDTISENKLINRLPVSGATAVRRLGSLASATRSYDKVSTVGCWCSRLSRLAKTTS